MAAPKIGDATCPLCKGTAAVSLAKSQLVVLTCNACNCQLFTRSDKSDSLVRALLKKEVSQAPPAPVAKPAPDPEPVPEPKATPEPAPAARPVRTGFGLGGARW